MEYTVNIPLKTVENKLDREVTALAKLLEDCGYKDEITYRPSDIRLHCPKCKDGPDNKDPGLRIWFKDRFRWKCFRCDAQKKMFDNLIGLYRFLFDESNPWKAVNKLVDVALKSSEKSSVLFPLELADFKNRPIHDVPPHILYWSVVDGAAPALTTAVKQEIANYLEVAPF